MFLYENSYDLYKIKKKYRKNCEERKYYKNIQPKSIYIIHVNLIADLYSIKILRRTSKSYFL